MALCYILAKTLVNYYIMAEITDMLKYFLSYQ